MEIRVISSSHMESLETAVSLDVKEGSVSPSYVTAHLWPWLTHVPPRSLAVYVWEVVIVMEFQIMGHVPDSRL